ncbi:hypothetical protein [Heliophilum fasciatum]|uniref:hypothetical protein n=1 Tax=Heliophilum fasciatum TaxID=35700 RepID=UPI00140491A0|nr:hypothetical protein [Heliophilum fasciatum]MCW2276647.1 hypothetical protein [Heliophilum fasciatum]
MNDQYVELMKKVIEQKKGKSASQGNNKRGESVLGSPRPATKKHKKGGLFDK